MTRLIPYEASYGATAFLLPDLLDAYQAIKESCADVQQMTIEAMLFRASAFLNKHAELHGTISNHLAGAALALCKAGQFFDRPEFSRKSGEIVDYILAKQSPEGWYVEYGGADPGYQTLCMYYLAQVYRLVSDKAEKEKLRTSLASSLDFLQYFIHPDGTFGGEYGSRRTEVYYPGGIALLSDEFPLAAAMSARMRTSIEGGSTVTLADIDMGKHRAAAEQRHPGSDIQSTSKDTPAALPAGIHRKRLPRRGHPGARYAALLWHRGCLHRRCYENLR